MKVMELLELYQMVMIILLKMILPPMKQHRMEVKYNFTQYFLYLVCHSVQCGILWFYKFRMSVCLWHLLFYNGYFNFA